MKDLTDKILELGSTPDWISPLFGMAQDLVIGDYCRFYVDRHSGWSLNAIRRLLSKYGIRIWNDFLTDDMIVFSVSAKQSRWAEYVLKQVNVPSPRPNETKKTPGFFQKLLDWLLS